ncbi:hypothetical protein, partial [Shewanella algae]|uniref:hypothetical protein n=1 Tax=Shewanella algae TaxID=38313 RepID=UPI0031F4D1DF
TQLLLRTLGEATTTFCNQLSVLSNGLNPTLFISTAVIEIPCTLGRASTAQISHFCVKYVRFHQTSATHGYLSTSGCSNPLLVLERRLKED